MIRVLEIFANHLQYYRCTISLNFFIRLEPHKSQQLRSLLCDASYIHAMVRESPKNSGDNK